MRPTAASDKLQLAEVAPFDPVHGPQACFRALLEAMANPMRAVPLIDIADFSGDTGRERLGAELAALLTVARTLLDHETGFWLSDGLGAGTGHAASSGALRREIIFHCSAHERAFGDADFVFAPVREFAEARHFSPGQARLGTPEYPDRSATFVLALAQNNATPAPEVRLRGPGIDGEKPVALPGLGSNFWQQLHANEITYPLGFDVIVCAGTTLYAIPRSTRVEIL